MHIHYLQHVTFEGLGSIEPWARQHGHKLTVTRPYLAETLPSLEGIELLIVMGGPMNIYQEQAHPWLVQEKRFLDRAIGKGLPVLGICLGAQLLADVLGARVFANSHKEIGWFPVSMTAEASTSGVFSSMPPTFEAFHWHGDTFDLPKGAKHMARSTACENQAFSYEDRVIGLQFHLETTLAGARQLLANCAAEIVPGPFIEEAGTLLADAGRFAALNTIMGDLLTRIIK